MIRAAGGIVWSRLGDLWYLAVIHRPKHQDWSLPKGKLEPGESWLEAAVREVGEETGCPIEVAGFAGLVSYLARGRPKVVLYWNMRVTGECSFTPGSEVDRLDWLTREQALARLDHPDERRLLAGTQPDY